MEENNEPKGWLTIILVIALIWAIFFHKDKYEGQTAEEWFNYYDYEVAINDELRDALQEANYNIEEANSMIDDAKWYAWESYEEMGEALDSLDNVETVSEP